MAGGVLIVGASMGGLRAAEQLRGAGYAGPMAMIGAEQHMPYNRPPLSKETLLKDQQPAQTAADLLNGLAFSIRPSLGDVAWHLGSPAQSADLARKVVTLASGREIAYDALAIATGLSPRRLSLADGKDCRHIVRTVDDAFRLRAALTPGAKVIVVGAGFIGCEVAASATKRGCCVTVVEPLPAPMVRAIGDQLATALQAYHEANGVTFRLNAKVVGLTCDDQNSRRLRSVTLDDGSSLPAEVLVEAIGSTCNVEWLDGNGLDLSDGMLTDNAMQVEGRAGIVAVGDVARFPNPRYGAQPRRVEHWAIPGQSAKRAASSIANHLLGKPAETKVFDPIPTFWSDQFGIRLQSMGMPGLADRSSVLEGELSAIGDPKGHGVAMGYWAGDQLIGVISIGQPVARLSQLRAMLG